MKAIKRTNLQRMLPRVPAAVFLILGLLSLSAHWHNQAGATANLPNLRGEAAITYLKQKGEYNSLAAAMKSAHLSPALNSPLVPQTKLTANDGAANDQLGNAVAISGTTAVVGAPLDNGGPSDQGAAYVFVNNGNGWFQQAKLSAADGAASDYFGSAVAISGETVLVGAPGDDVSGSDQGSAYVFTRTGNTWSQQQKLVAADGAVLDSFGTAVALDGDTALIGSYNSDLPTGVNQGAAYVFTRSGAVWSQQQKLVADNGAGNDFFGFAVALGGDTAAIGAYGKDVSGNPDRGAAYIFTRTGGAWSQQQILTAADGAANDYFGSSLALSGDTLAVGAYSDSIGLNTDQGSVYVFARANGTWSQQQKLTANDGAANDHFGRAVAASGDVIVIGAEDDDLGTQSGQGSVYVFARSGATWGQYAKLTVEEGAANDLFGHAVAIRGDLVLAGAPANQVGQNAQQGAVYTFTVAADFGFSILSASDGVSGDSFGHSVAISGTTAVVGARAVGDLDGAVYVFVRPFGSWTFQQKLTVSGNGRFFGSAVAIEGDRIVVGEEGNGGHNNGSGIEGSAYVFVRSNNVWSQQQKLQASDGVNGNYFGCAVAISGNTVIIGARLNFGGVSFSDAGAYVFTFDGNVWNQQQKLLPSTGSSWGFGNAVAVEGDVALVGAYNNSPGGAVFFFTRSNGTWSQQQILSVGWAGAEFGTSVSLNNDTAVIGAPGEKIGQNDGQGAAYVYQRNGAAWGLVQKLTASDGAAGDKFGYSVGLSGDLIVVGAGEDSITVSQQGSAYPFKRNGASWDEQKKLVAGAPEANDFFGNAVAVSGDKIIVGAYGDDNKKGIAYAFGSVSCSAFPITVNPAALPGGSVGAAYSQTISASGGAGPYQFSVSAGALPPGITLSQNGALSGAPTASGTYNFMITALATTLCPGVRSYTLTITGGCPAIAVTPANPALPAGQAGQTYNQAFGASNGAAPYSLAISAGALPNGLTLASNGVLSGVPTAFGNFNFTVKATDLNGCQGVRAYALTIIQPCANITINPATLPDGTPGAAYNQTVTALGGTAPHTFTISAGGLPGGLNLASGGALTGTPSVTGSFNFTIKATDANGCFGSRAYTITVNGNGGSGVTGLQFYPLPRPVRILDTRAGQGNCDNVSTPINGGSSLSTFARLTCEGISIPANAQAVVGNVTVLNQTAQTGYMTIYPDGQNPPVAANMIYGPNGILANNFTVGLGANGNFNIFGEKTIDAVVDISGYYAPPAAGGLYYHPLSKPIRLLDTRAGQGNCDNVNAPIAAGTSITTLARTTCQGLTIPQAAQAIVGIATVINVSGQTGYLTIYPNGVPAPLAANMVYFPGQLLSNAFTVPLSANGEFNIFGEKTIDMVIDVAGYYSNEANDANGAGLLLTPLATPVRLLDTRAGQGNCDSVSAPIAAGTSLTKMARMTCEGQLIPNNAQAVIGNVTVINQTGLAGYLTLYPTGQAAPLAANMIYTPNQILSNAFVVGLSAAGQFNLFAERTLDAIVDVSGFFAP
jgi:hypothetical protein